jgi:FkbM family methyltransferase
MEHLALATETSSEMLLRNSITAFALAYGRQPTAQEMPIIEAAATSATGMCDLLRRVVAVFDRQTIGTPISVRFGQSDLATVVLDGFTLVVDGSDWAVSRTIVDNMIYEPHLTAFIREHVKPGMTAIDIGANIGYFSMLLASLVGRLGHVLSFEPNSENCRLILLSAGRNGFENVRLFPLALSNERGNVFYTPAIGSNGVLLPSRMETLLNPNCVVVPCDRLDNLVSGRVDFIKADVEGAEYLALSGGESILRRDRPIVTAELSMEMLSRQSKIDGGDFLRWMKGIGYRLFLLGRNDAQRREVVDIDGLVADWGSPVRIEDLAFIPRF